MVIVRRLWGCCFGLTSWLRRTRLVEANERLEARVAELERRLNRSSRNSSLPPSQDPPSAPPRPRGKGSGRKRGGQHGHEGRLPAAASARAGRRGRRALARPVPVVRARVRRAGARRCRRAVSASGRRAAADRGQGDRASAAPGLLPGVRSGDSGRASRRRRGGRSGRGSRPRSSRSRCATASRAVTRPSSPGSCSGSSSRPGRWTRSSSAPAEPARFSVYRWVVRCCRGCGLRSGCAGLPSPASSCNSFAMMVLARWIASQISLSAASSLGKWPRVLIVLRICMCRLSTVLVV